MFKDGHVQNICAHISTNFTYYVADCLPEMKKTIPYTIKLIIDNNSADVEYATCKCPAGTGPKGSCKHIAAMCYALEDFTRECRLREHVPCTSHLQTWNQPRKCNLDTVNVSDIKLVKME